MPNIRYAEVYLDNFLVLRLKASRSLTKDEVKQMLIGLIRWRVDGTTRPRLSDFEFKLFSKDDYRQRILAQKRHSVVLGYDNTPMSLSTWEDGYNTITGAPNG